MKDKEHVCTYVRGMNWHTFSILDRKLQELSRYIALDESNRKTWSEELASLLLLTGSAIDTFFRDMAECPYVQKTPTYKMVSERIAKKARRYKRKKKIDWTIIDFRDAYEPFYEFSKNLVTVPFGLGTYKIVKPYEEFAKNKVPSWWTAYNKVKHKYYKNLKEKATLGNVIDSLAGLLVLNALHKCAQEYLIRSRQLKLGNLSIEHAVTESKKTPKGMPQAFSPFGGYIITSNYFFRLRMI